MEMNVSRRECNTIDASFEDFPEEIQIDILSRLSPKSLSRCKCVSKHWNYTLTIQIFLLKHSRSYDKLSKLVFIQRSNSWIKGSVMSFEHSHSNTHKTAESEIKGHDAYFAHLPSNYIYMSNICNDLICLFDTYSTCVGLVNIKTRDFVRLPVITIKSEELFRPWYALGFDPVHNVFKLLSIIYGSTSKNCTRTKAAILTVGSKYWNPIDYRCLPSSLIKESPWQSIINSLCLDGVIYWVHQNTIGNLFMITAVAFDLNREAFRDNELVMTPMNGGSSYYLTCLKECPTLFIWKKKSDYTYVVEQWTLFNHKNPNAVWKRNLANYNLSSEVPYWRYCSGGSIVAGGSTLVKYLAPIYPGGSNWYSLDDLENFAIG